MAQIILVENNITFHTVYSLNLHVYVGADVILKKNHLEVLELLKSQESINLILCRNSIGGEKTALEIYKFLTKAERAIPMIVLGDEPLLGKFTTILPSDVDIKVLVKSCAQSLGITPKLMVSKEVPDFFPIPIFYFMGLSELKCDVFVKMHAHDNYHFMKKFNAGAVVNMLEIENLMAKGIKGLYIPKEFRLKFASDVTTGLTRKLKNKDLSELERVNLTNSSIELVREQSSTVGLTLETIELSTASIESLSNLVECSPNLKTMLNKVLKDKNSFLYQHCQLITYISFFAIEHLKWGSKEQYNCLAFVSFFHDICLPKEIMAKMDSEENLLKSSLSNSEREIVRRHALNAMALTEKFPRAPMGADLIIKQHHGAIGGIGFPHQFSNNISPLAIIFIIAEEFTHHILSKKSEQQDLYQFLYQKYPRPMYRKVISALESLDGLKDFEF